MDTNIIVTTAIILILGIAVFILATYFSAIVAYEKTEQFRAELLKIVEQLKQRNQDLGEFKGWQSIKPWPREFLFTEIDKQMEKLFEHAQVDIRFALNQQYSLKAVILNNKSWRGLLSVGSNIDAILNYRTNLTIMNAFREHLDHAETDIKKLAELRGEIRSICRGISEDLNNLEKEIKKAVSSLQSRNDFVNEFKEIQLPLENARKCTTQAEKVLDQPGTNNDIQFGQAKIWVKTGKLFLRLSTLINNKVSVPSLYKLDLLEPKLQNIFSLACKSMEGGISFDFASLRLKYLHLGAIENQITEAEKSFERFSLARKELEVRIVEMKNLDVMGKITRAQTAERELEDYWGTMDVSSEKWKSFLGSDKLPSRRLQSNRNDFQKLIPQLDNVFESKMDEILDSLSKALGEIKILMEQITKIKGQTAEEMRAEQAVKSTLGENGSTKKAIDDINKIITKCEPKIAQRIKNINEKYLSFHERAQVRRKADYPVLEGELAKLKKGCVGLLEDHNISMQNKRALAAKIDKDIAQLRIEIAKIEKRLPSSRSTHDELMTIVRQANLAYTEAGNSDEHSKFSKYEKDTNADIKQLVSKIVDVNAEIAQQEQEGEELKEKLLALEESIKDRVGKVSEKWKNPLSKILDEINQLEAEFPGLRLRCGRLHSKSLKDAAEEIASISEGIGRIRKLSNVAIGELQETQTALINRESEIESLIDDLKNSGYEPDIIRTQLEDAQKNLDKAKLEPSPAWALNYIDDTLARLKTRPNYYVNQPISLRDVYAQGPVVVGNNNAMNIGLSDETVAKLFTEIQVTAERISDLSKRIEAQKYILQLETEAKKGERADEGKIEKWLEFLYDISEDVGEVAITTFLNPAKGFALVFKKVAERIMVQRRSKSDLKRY